MGAPAGRVGPQGQAVRAPAEAAAAAGEAAVVEVAQYARVSAEGTETPVAMDSKAPLAQAEQTAHLEERGTARQVAAAPPAVAKLSAQVRVSVAAEARVLAEVGGRSQVVEESVVAPAFQVARFQARADPAPLVPTAVEG